MSDEQVFKKMQQVAIAHPCWSNEDANRPRFQHRFARTGMVVFLTVRCMDYVVESWGGAVWHVSVGHPYLHRDTLSGYALAALDGVGDATLGESRTWNDQVTGKRLDPEWEGNQFDVFRRLAASEEKLGVRR